jgi:hypothetical protein
MHISLDIRKWISSVHLCIHLRRTGTINANQPQTFKLTLQNTERTVYSASLTVRICPYPPPPHVILSYPRSLLTPHPVHLAVLLLTLESAFVLARKSEMLWTWHGRVTPHHKCKHTNGQTRMRNINTHRQATKYAKTNNDNPNLMRNKSENIQLQRIRSHLFSYFYNHKTYGENWTCNERIAFVYKVFSELLTNYTRDAPRSAGKVAITAFPF